MRRSTYLVAAADCDPAPFENGSTTAVVNLAEPGDRSIGRRFRASAADIVVGEGKVERILTGSERFWDVSVASVWIWIVVPAIVRSPLPVPSTHGIRSRIILGGLLSDPENRGDDVSSPGKTSVGVSRLSRGKYTRQAGFFANDGKGPLRQDAQLDSGIGCRCCFDRFGAGNCRRLQFTGIRCASKGENSGQGKTGGL